MQTEKIELRLTKYQKAIIKEMSARNNCTVKDLIFLSLSNYLESNLDGTEKNVWLKEFSK